MKDSIIDKILSTSGYLPPRNEEEMIAFEQMYSKVMIDEGFHVDVKSIVDGGCQYTPHGFPMSGQSQFSQNDIRMAARNYESLPNDVLVKLKKQHKSDGN